MTLFLSSPSMLFPVSDLQFQLVVVRVQPYFQSCFWEVWGMWGQRSGRAWGQETRPLFRAQTETEEHCGGGGQGRAGEERRSQEIQVWWVFWSSRANAHVHTLCLLVLCVSHFVLDNLSVQSQPRRLIHWVLRSVISWTLQIWSVRFVWGEISLIQSWSIHTACNKSITTCVTYAKLQQVI